MAYTNSPLVAYKKLSPNHSGQRTHSIDRISPHCVVGQCTAEGLGDWFAATSTKASSNYGIDRDGRIGLYVEEKNRSWCTSSNANDQRAVTIECASDTKEPYTMNNKVYAALITLCADICKRNGKKKLLWFADKSKSLNYEPKADEMVITVHRWFANKSCPGDWLYARLGDVAAKVTAQLGGEETAPVVEKTGLTKGDTGEAVKTMQAMLIACGYSCGSTGADGDFGKNTLAGLKAFQKDAGLAVDGVYGKDTKSALEKKYKAVTAEAAKSGLQASTLKGLSEADVVKNVGSLFTADMKKNGILASVSMAQFILESGYGQTDLAQGANNCFGMKKSLSGNTWGGSTWDGVSIYTKKTQEDDGKGNLYTITADFRKYPCVEDSVADHSAYLLGAKNGSKLRYVGLRGETDYKKAIQIIKDGGYATDTKYVSKICSIIERWNLTQYDLPSTPEKQEAEAPSTQAEDKSNFRVIADRKINDITKENLSQIPAKRGSNKIEFIVCHYLGVPNADNPYLYGGGYGGHYNIKRDGSIYKAADPKTAVVWHCGGGLQGSEGHSFYKICGNYNSIGIECGVCYTDTSVKDASGDSGQWYFTTETQEGLVWLVSKLMDEYGISIRHVIRHFDVTGKICPNPYVKNNKLRTSWTWDEFKALLAQYRKTGGYSTDRAAEATEAKWYRVRKSWNDASSQVGAYLVLANAKEECDKHPDYSVYDWNGKAVYTAAGAKFPYLVRISIDDLNIREKPTVNSKSHGYTGKGVYTIMDEQDGWGLLKSYADKRNGWIKLSYTEKL